MYNPLKRKCALTKIVVLFAALGMMNFISFMPFENSGSMAEIETDEIAMAAHSQVIMATDDDTTAPSSNIEPIDSYWLSMDPFTITATAYDGFAGIDAVELWYAYEEFDDVLFGIDTAPPWQWNFTWPGGQGDYEFYTRAKDLNGNYESKPDIADETAGFDFETPYSCVDTVVTYYQIISKLMLTISALDHGPSGLEYVELWYRFSQDNVTWGDEVQYFNDTNSEDGWGGLFDFPLDQGYYKFYSKAGDIAGNCEVISSEKYSMCYYIPPIKHSNEKPLNNGYSHNNTPVISVCINSTSSIDPESIKFNVNGYSICHDLKPLINGYEVSYWHEAGFAYNEVVRCRIIAKNYLFDTLDYSWCFTASFSFDIALNTGWNLISFPLEQRDNTTAGLFASHNESLTTLLCYEQNDVDDHWKSFSCDRPASLNDLHEIDHTMGFWLYANKENVLTVSGCIPYSTQIPLKAGWNLVGYPSLIEKRICEALASTYYTSVEGYSNQYLYNLEPLGDEDMMKPGNGYWICVPVDTVWVVDW